jgi:predicted esterase
MAIESYDALFNTTMSLYRDGQYSAALDLLTSEGAQFPEHTSMIFYLRSCMASRAGLPEHALEILAEAVSRGFWYGAETMRQTPSWLNLQGDPEFERLAEICIARQTAAVADPKIFILSPDSDVAHPLVFALHGNGDNGLHTLYGWNALLDMDWMLAAPQSAQAESSDAFVWNDQSIALRQLVKQYQDLHQEYLVDERRVVIAGFSMGGETALRLSLIGPLPIKGFILLGPGGPTIDDLEDWIPALKEAKGRKLRGYVLLGEKDDTVPHDQIHKLVEMLNKHNIPCKLEVIPDLRHDYPTDARPLLERALAFIEQEG